MITGTQASVSSLHIYPSPQGSLLLAHASPFSSQYSVPSQKVPLSGQSTGVPAWQSNTGSQTSLPLQNCASSQTALSGILSQPSDVSLQVSVVQAIASSQRTGVPG
jgi:hypothetical protein